MIPGLRSNKQINAYESSVETLLLSASLGSAQLLTMREVLTRSYGKDTANRRHAIMPKSSIKKTKTLV
jgi:hypothetical protein